MPMCNDKKIIVSERSLAKMQDDIHKVENTVQRALMQKKFDELIAASEFAFTAPIKKGGNHAN